MTSRIIPIKQGSIDGLCSVYAVLNACRLLRVTGDERFPRAVRMDQTKRLFRALCLSDETRELFPKIVCAGTLDIGLEKLLSVAQKWALRHSNLQLGFEQPSLTHIGGARRYFEALRNTLKTSQPDEHKAFILGVAPPRDHWTVVKRISGDKAYFFDSASFPAPRRKWAGFAEFTFDRRAAGVSTGKRHVIDAKASYLLTSRCN